MISWHQSTEYLGVDSGLPHPSLVALEDGHDDLQLGLREGCLLPSLPRGCAEARLGVHLVLVVWRTGEHWGTLTGDLSSDGVRGGGGGGGGYLYLQVRLQSNCHGTHRISPNHNLITQIFMNKLSGHNADVSGIVGLLVFELQIYSFTIK